MARMIDERLAEIVDKVENYADIYVSVGDMYEGALELIDEVKRLRVVNEKLTSYTTDLVDREMDTYSANLVIRDLKAINESEADNGAS